MYKKYIKGTNYNWWRWCSRNFWTIPILHTWTERTN